MGEDSDPNGKNTSRTSSPFLSSFFFVIKLETQCCVDETHNIKDSVTKSGRHQDLFHKGRVSARKNQFCRSKFNSQHADGCWVLPDAI